MRDDYKEVLQLVSIVFDLSSAKLYKLKKPGAFHHARWMAKIVYFLKMFVFGIQMKYPEPVMQLLKRISTFFAFIYVVPWLACTNAANAFANDLVLLQKLNQYSAIDQGVTYAALTVLNRHLWYLTPELAPLALFNSLLSNHEKQEAAEKLLQLDPKLSKESPLFL